MPSLALQRWDWSDRLLHCHHHPLRAAEEGGCGRHPEDHLPAETGQVSCAWQAGYRAEHSSVSTPCSLRVLWFVTIEEPSLVLCQKKESLN